MNKLIETNLVHQVKDDYLAYSMAVLIGRAIPRLTDGMKPIHRRILTAMRMLNLKPDGRYMKSARVEGEVMGKYSPHGSSYGSMVTLAAPWNNNLPFVEGHGNWGSSVDGAAASRYTECKLSQFAWDCLLDDSDTWLTAPNYDGSLQEPTELNVKVPAVLINGQDGIGVGYACKIPSHNLRDICDAVTKDSPLYPDFPTGSQIIRDEGLADYVRTGIGSIRVRAILEIATQEKSGRAKERAKLTFTSLPPSTNPEKIGQQIKDALEKGKFEGISEVIDESDLTGDRVTIIAKPGVDPGKLSQYLFYHTDLDTKFSARTLVIDGTRPVELSASELITRWKTWRLRTLERKFATELEAKELRLEIVAGLLKAIDKIDAVIKVIRAATSPKEALIELVSNRTLKFTSEQARAILEMKLRSLTNLDSEELNNEKAELEARIIILNDLIANDKARTKYMMTEIKNIGTRHGESRRSQLIDPPESLAIEKGASRATPTLAKPKFLKIDMKRGVVEQSKGPRGCLLLEKTEKLITVTSDNIIKKLPATFKGVLGESYAEVKLAKKESDVVTRKYLVVFKLENAVKAMVVNGEDLAKVTSKGKNLLPANSELLHFGEGTYKVEWVSARKKPTVLDLTVKVGKPGGKGIKVGNLSDILG